MDITPVIHDDELREELMEMSLVGKLTVPFTTTIDTREIGKALKEGRPLETLSSTAELESIVLLFGRPSLLVSQDSFAIPASDVWKKRLENVKDTLKSMLKSVGRIELKNHPGFSWVGTGWLVRPNIIVTNRHVAEEFAYKSSDGFVFKKSPENRNMAAWIDFKEEYRQPDELEIDIKRVIYLAPPDKADVAFLEIEPRDGLNAIELEVEEITSRRSIAVIGYPARDSRIPDPAVMRQVFGDIYDVKRLAPGEVLRVEQNVFLHDCSTLGGNSGSVVVDLETGKAVGIHFAGTYLTANYAVSSSHINNLLREVA